jgi:hypothetical protein
MYCVYLTIYRGNQLPPFYIGYVKQNKIANGYHGSVTSKRFGPMWKKELRDNPHLFDTRVLCSFETKREAQLREHELQTALNVVSNPLYINLCIYGKQFDHPKGVRRTTSFKTNHSDKMKELYQNGFRGRRGSKQTDATKQKISDAKIGKNMVLTEEERQRRISFAATLSTTHPSTQMKKNNSKIFICSKCSKEVQTLGAFKRWHDTNCRN